MSVAPTPAPRQFPPLGWFGTAIPASYQTALGIVAQSITVYNNSPANLAVFPTLPPARPTGAFPWGGIIVPAFYPQNIPVSSWTSFAFATDGTLTFALSSLVVFISEAPGGAPLSPFGPSGWGAGAGPPVITQINPGDPILAWQLQQVIGAFLGTMAVPGPIDVSATNVNGTSSLSIAAFAPLAGPDAQPWTVAVNGLGQLEVMVGASNVVVITPAGRLEVIATGASGKTLLNYVPILDPQVTTVSGTGATAKTAFTVTGLPSSAVAVAVSIQQQAAGAGDATLFFSSTSAVQPQGVVRTQLGGTAQNDLAGVFSCTQGSTNQLAYQASSAGGTWSFSLRLDGYFEAS